MITEAIEIKAVAGEWPSPTNPREMRAYAHEAIAEARKRPLSIHAFQEAIQAVKDAGSSSKSLSSGFENALKGCKTGEAITTLGSQLEEVYGWDFDDASVEASKDFITGLLTRTREVLVPFDKEEVEIKDQALLPREITDALKRPFKYTTVLLGFGTSFAKNEDQGKLVVGIAGGGPNYMDYWQLLFVLESDGIRLERSKFGTGESHWKLEELIEKYQGDEKTSLKIIGGLVKTSIQQNLAIMAK